MSDARIEFEILTLFPELFDSFLATSLLGKAITANTVALGVLVGLTSLVSRDAIEKAIAARAPKGTEEMNRKALQAGFGAAEQVKAAA